MASKKKPHEETLVPAQVERAILHVRGQRVLSAEALARLYGVTVSALNQAVKRNAERFPEDFMFQLDEQEAAHLRSQSVISSGEGRHGGRRHLPYAFTEQGVAMLSSVLRSPRAVAVNIEIMRAFVRLRGMLQEHVELAKKLTALEKKYDAQFRVVFDAIRDLMAPTVTSRQPVGFRKDER